jgi:tyrosine-specific transport protein
VNNDKPLQALIFAMDTLQDSPWMSAVINLFSHAIIITSFLGVTLSLFDFLQDKEHKQMPHRGRTALLTFLPPLLVVTCYPNAFIQLLSYASIFVAAILTILPALMAWRLRKMTTLTSSYTVPGGTMVLVIVALAGSAFIAIEIIRMSGGFAQWLG